MGCRRTSDISVMKTRTLRFTYAPLPRDDDDDVLERKRERRWVLLKIPRGDIDGVGEGK